MGLCNGRQITEHNVLLLGCGTLHICIALLLGITWQSCHDANGYYVLVFGHSDCECVSAIAGRSLNGSDWYHIGLFITLKTRTDWILGIIREINLDHLDQTPQNIYLAISPNVYGKSTPNLFHNVVLTITLFQTSFHNY